MNQKLYKEIPAIELLAGDTLPSFSVSVLSGKTPVSGTMQIIVSRAESPDRAVLKKNCKGSKGVFSVTVTGAETANWNGEYVFHLAFFTSGGNVYRRLAGRLYVHPAAQGGSNG